MSIFFKIKKVKQSEAIQQLKDAFPCVNSMKHSQIIERLEKKTNFKFYEEIEEEVPSILVRLSVFLYFVVCLISICYLPIHFIFTGRWFYRNNCLENWSRMLKL